MEITDRLACVKSMIDIPPGYPDEKVKAYIDEVIYRMIDSGVEKSVAESKKAIGCVARGVDDLMRSNGMLSADFNMRIVQLAYDGSEGAK